MRPVAVDGGLAALEALSAAAERGQPFALVLLDARMPGMDGHDVALAIGGRAELAVTRVLMLGSSAVVGEAGRSRNIGVAGYLAKPAKVTDLLREVTRVLNSTTGSEPDTAQVRRGPSPQSPPLRLRKVLVAEDNLINQRIAQAVLVKRGHQVTLVGNGVDAVAAVAREHFDVVLMDVQMPEMDGFEATATIRARERETGGHMRIVAMTAHALAGDVERCLQQGMDDYLSKPLTAQVLWAMVEREQEPAACALAASA
jgi:CheY-like chemotaxis protein